MFDVQPSIPTQLEQSTPLAPTHPDLIHPANDLFTTARTDSPDFPVDESPRKKQPKPTDE